MPDKKQWEHLRNLDRLVAKAQNGTFRERYLRSEINRLRKDMGLPALPAPSRPATKLDATTLKHLPDSLTANAKLPSDSSTAKTLFDVETGDE